MGLAAESDETQSRQEDRVYGDGLGKTTGRDIRDYICFKTEGNQFQW